MSTKKVVSLLTLLFLLFFLIVSAFPDEKPIPDADPWEGTQGVEPIPENESGFMVICFKTVCHPPYFFILFEKVPAPTTPVVKGGCRSTHSRGSSLLRK